MTIEQLKLAISNYLKKYIVSVEVKEIKGE